MSEQIANAFTRRVLLESIGGATALHRVAAQTPAPVGERPIPKQVQIGIVGGGFGSSFQWHPHTQAKVTGCQMFKTARCGGRPPVRSPPGHVRDEARKRP